MTLSGFMTMAGSVTGREHRRALRDGQDGFAIVARPRLTAAIVTDGCSSGKMSEVGARLGAAWLAGLVGSSFRACTRGAACANEQRACSENGQRRMLDLETIAQEVTGQLIARIDATARSISPDLDPTIVGEMLLFGFLAAVVISD